MANKTMDEFKKVALDGIAEGQAETGVPLSVPPVTKEQREAAATKIVASWYVRLWRYLFG
jgi:hypothetical protein